MNVSAAEPLLLTIQLCDEESFEEEELQVAWSDNEEAESHRPPADVLRVGHQQEVVSTPPHAAKAVVTEHVEDVYFHSVTGALQDKPRIIILIITAGKTAVLYHTSKMFPV